MRNEPALETISARGEVLAMIVRRGFSADGIQFFTPGDFSQQLGYMRREQGYVIPAHRHLPVDRAISMTQEVLFVRSGRLEVDLFDGQGVLVAQREVTAGDVVLLAGGGHGFTMLTECEILEVKQGPYAGDADKELLGT
jgi:hypothetical protein